MHQVTRHNFMSLGHTRAGLEALVKRVMKLGIVSTSAFSKPRTTLTTTTAFPGIRSDTTFWTCAGLEALVKRVAELGIASASAFSKPRTTVTTTTAFPGSRGNATFRTYGTGSSRCSDCSAHQVTRHDITRYEFTHLGQPRAGFDTLVKRVIKLVIVSTSAFSKPRTTVTTTTDFPGFRHNATFWTFGTGSGRCSGCSGVSVTTMHDATRRGFMTPGCTRAGVHALDPRVSRTGACASALLEPRTTPSATTAFSGLFEGGALAHGAVQC